MYFLPYVNSVLHGMTLIVTLFSNDGGTWKMAWVFMGDIMAGNEKVVKEISCSCKLFAGEE